MIPVSSRISSLVTLFSFLVPQLALADVARPVPLERFSAHDRAVATTELVRVAESALVALDQRIAGGQTRFEITQDRVLETMGISKSDEEALLASNEAFFQIKKKSVFKTVLSGTLLRTGLASALNRVKTMKEPEKNTGMPRALSRLLTFVIVAGSTLAGVVYLQPWVIATIPGVVATGPVWVAGAIGFAGGCILGAIFQSLFESKED